MRVILDTDSSSIRFKDGSQAVVRWGGAGRQVIHSFVEAAVDEARRRGARRLTLRVLGPNYAARRLYETCGFEIEGVLHGEFHVDGEDIDDVLMARAL